MDYLFSTLQLLVAACTLLIAWKVYKKLIPDELKKRQLETVLELIEHLNTYTFNMHSLYFGGDKLYPDMAYTNNNIFEYKKIYLKKDDVKSNEDIIILLLEEDSHAFELSRFIENPLMPSAIVPHLAPFISIIAHQYSDKLEAQDKIMVFEKGGRIKEKRIEKEDFYKSTATALLNHSTFLEAINNLVEEIESWCKANDLPDLNFRTTNSRNLNNK